MSRVLVGGGTGFLGTALRNALRQEGCEVTVLSRSLPRNAANTKDRFITFEEIENNGLPQFDAIIHLSGANIVDSRWTPKRKKELYDSRIGTTRKLIRAIGKNSTAPKLFVLGSAVGIYPSDLHGEVEYDEDFELPATSADLPFAEKLCHDWEGVLEEDDAKNVLSETRSAFLRTGIVLSSKGGALQKMLFPFQLGFGGRIGAGTQYFPWIHIDDWVRLVKHVISHEEISGPVNLVAPEPVTNDQFTAALGKALHRATPFPVPAFVLKLVLQERAQLLLEGQRVVPKRALETGFRFGFADIDSALENILSAHSTGWFTKVISWFTTPVSYFLHRISH